MATQITTSPEVPTGLSRERKKYQMPKVEWRNPAAESANAYPYGIIVWHDNTAPGIGEIVLKVSNRGAVALPVFPYKYQRDKVLYAEARKQLTKQADPTFLRSFDKVPASLELPSVKPDEPPIVYSALLHGLTADDRRGLELNNRGLVIYTYEDAAERMVRSYERNGKRATLASYTLMQYLGQIS